VPLSDVTSELASSAIWSNQLETTEVDQHYHEQALFLDPCDVGILLKLEQKQLVQSAQGQKSFLL
jgi:uncharacterized protein YjhX (UPF0386 family)